MYENENDTHREKESGDYKSKNVKKRTATRNARAPAVTQKGIGENIWRRTSLPGIGEERYW